ncbi:hypothetical protein DL240_15470 [Lujinxingia litoralis]|uniref:P/Homo B domain-containing protein n=1 Tax=Lujinxingia litoralis TaxID=2211119 RepID=A0A328C4F4_9DELT|nr:proprotein convertase P-domain-containing protein [Lujinxingia litoralis]RAL20715.1 hypothetical protein DL240_15470 [Lujinxingia litoralis]
MKRLTPWNLPLSGILALAMVACGGGETETPDPLECGPGTELSGGQCVLTDSTCGEGLTRNDQDQCVPTDELCGENTTYDTASGTCLGPDEIACGEGTVEIDGRCLVDNPLTCGEGTVLANGSCELTEDICGEGTQLEGTGCALMGDVVCQGRTQFDVAQGICVDLGNVECGDDVFEVENRCVSVDTVADNLASSADVVYEEGGENAFTLPEAEASLVFAGVMESDDAGEHAFTLTAEAGDWFELTVFSRGLPSPMAIVTDGDYDRATSSAQTRVAQRTFALPTDGDYTVTIANALNQLNGTANSGDGTWAYVAQINRVTPPEAKPWPGLEEVVSGDLSDLTENLYLVEFPADYNLAMTIDALGADAQAVVDEWATLTEHTDTTALEQGDIFVPERPASDAPVYLLFDQERQTGPATHFVVSSARAVNIPVDETYEFEVVAQPGQMLEISYTTTSPSGFSNTFEISKNGEELARYTNIDPLNNSTSWSTRAKQIYFFAAEGGTYTIAMTNENWSSTFYNVVPVITNIDPTPIPVVGDESFTFSHEEAVEAGTFEFYRLDISTPASFEGFLRTGELVYDEDAEEWIEDENNPGAGDPDVYLIGSDNFLKGEFEETGTFEALEFTLLTPGSYIMAISVYEALTQGYVLELNATERQALVPEEIISETFTLDTYDIIRGSAEFADGESATLRIYNPDDVVIYETEASGNFEFLRLAPGPGDYRVELSNDSEASILRPTYEFEGITDAAFYEVSLGSLDLSTTGAVYSTGDRDYYLLRASQSVLSDMTFAVPSGSGESLSVKIFSKNTGNTLREQVGNLIAFEDVYLSNDLFIVEVKASSALADGYTFNLDFNEVVGVPEVSVSESPNSTIVDNDETGVTRTLTANACLTIESVSVDIDITHGYRGDVVVTLTSPAGTTVYLHNRTGSYNDDIVGSYPDTLTPAGSLDDFIGESGQGDWQLYVADVSSGINGTLNSWGINLTCGI